MVNQPLPRSAFVEALPAKPVTRYPITPLVTARILLVTDVLGLLICISLVYATWELGPQLTPGQLLEAVRSGSIFSWISMPFSGCLLVYLFCLYLANTYRLVSRLAAAWTIIRVCLSLSVALVLTTTLSYFLSIHILNSENIPNSAKGFVLPMSIGLFMIWAVATRLFALSFLRRTQEKSCWLILSHGSGIADLDDRIEGAPGSNTKMVRLVDSLKIRGDSYQSASTAQLTDILHQIRKDSGQQHCAGVILENPTPQLSDDVVKTLMQLRLQGFCVYSLEDYYEQVWYKIPPMLIKDDWFAFTGGFSLFHNRINVKLKRMMDLVTTALVLILVLPLMILVAIAIKLDSKGPIFYNQTRTGLNGRPFKVHKFRSMVTDAEKKGIQWALDRDDRITRVGRIVRLLRIDELPQLWNVLKGEMSLIGPRPERPEFDCQLEQEIPYYNIRYLVRPGITGWAQVNYPYGASVEDAYHKVSYDLFYIKNYSLLLDFAIVLKTLRVVILGKGR